jgi:hypothetical protein
LVKQFHLPIVGGNGPENGEMVGHGRGAYLIVVAQVPENYVGAAGASASRIGRFFEYSHFREIELAFNSWRGVNELRPKVVRQPERLWFSAPLVANFDNGGDSQW